MEKKRYGYTTAADLSAFTPEQVVPYSYGDTNWKDRLTAYDGKPIACDPIGNPLFYDGWTYTWKAGRMLHRMVRDGVDAQFTYDHTGLRVKKSVNGVDTLYTLNGKRITHMRKGPVQMHFFYDAQGRPAMVRYNNTDYAYLHNLQGDIVGIVDMDGSQMVQYGYDAWGKPISAEGSMASTLGHDNPFRYRGYVYDEETGLYYVNSRYYHSGICRFINADTTDVLSPSEDLYDKNLFAYCDNDPINRIDCEGDFWSWDILFGVVAIVTAVVAVAAVVVATAGAAVPAFVVAGGGVFGSGGLAAGAVAVAATGIAASSAAIATVYEAHKSNIRPSSRETHENGEARDKTDNGGEKGDRKRKGRKKPGGNRNKKPPSYRKRGGSSFVFRAEKQ